MSFLLDTDIVIHVRDANDAITERLFSLAGAISISLITVIELQGGIAAQPEFREQRRAGMMRLARRFPVLKLDSLIVDAYGSLVQQTGYSRTRVFDRLIAATAMVHDLTLVTINGTHFRDISDLKLEVWPSPIQ